MAVVKLSDELVERIKIMAAKEHRTVPKQIEYLVEKGIEQTKSELSAQDKLKVFKNVMKDFDQTMTVLAK